MQAKSLYASTDWEDDIMLAHAMLFWAHVKTDANIAQTHFDAAMSVRARANFCS